MGVPEKGITSMETFLRQTKRSIKVSKDLLMQIHLKEFDALQKNRDAFKLDLDTYCKEGDQVGSFGLRTN